MNCGEVSKKLTTHLSVLHVCIFPQTDEMAIICERLADRINQQVIVDGARETFLKSVDLPTWRAPKRNIPSSSWFSMSKIRLYIV